MNDHYAVSGRVNVELYRFRTQLDGPGKGGYRVLGQGVVCPTVGDLERGTAVFDQAFLRRFGLGRGERMTSPGSGQSALTLGFPARLPIQT